MTEAILKGKPDPDCEDIVKKNEKLYKISIFGHLFIMHLPMKTKKQLGIYLNMVQTHGLPKR